MRYGDSIFAQHEAGAVFVTRKKENARYRATKRRRLDENKGDGFQILDDAEVKLASKGVSKLPSPCAACA